MSIKDSIKEARKRGIGDDRILEEIRRQNPAKEELIKDFLEQGLTPTDILEKIINGEIFRREEDRQEKMNNNIFSETENKTDSLKLKEEDKEDKIGNQENKTIISDKEKGKEKEEEDRLITEAERRLASLSKDNLNGELTRKDGINEELARDKKEIDKLFQRIKEGNKIEEKNENKEEEVSIQDISFKKESQSFPLLKKSEQSFSQEQEEEKQNKKESQGDFNLPSDVFQNIPRRPSERVKLGLRIGIVITVLVILSGVATFWYWYLVVKNQPPSVLNCLKDADCPSGEICNQGVCVLKEQVEKEECQSDNDCQSGMMCKEGKCVVKEPENNIPPSLLLVSETKILEVSNKKDISQLLSQSLREWQKKGEFVRLVIKSSDNKVFGLRDFLETMLVRLPEEFYEKVDDNFTLFIYSQDQGNRIGFITRIKDYKDLEDILREEEAKMKDDFQPIFSLMGYEGSPIVPYFRDSVAVRGYIGPNFRYQTISSDDVGILYLVSGDYFIFTTSWKSMEEIVKKLGVTGERLEITKELKRGDTGYEVKLLQTWLAQDASVYPEGIVNGIFGPLTEKAVIRFQEKYASDILAPQGLVKGTGVVDSYTRMKLNELYGDSGVKPIKEEITSDLRLGSFGGEVKLLQSWLAQDQSIYPEGIISGYFGYLTQRAVIRFQEKYANDILVPQGLTRGTGIVDALTRKKLNEIYGKNK